MGNPSLYDDKSIPDVLMKMMPHHSFITLAFLALLTFDAPKYPGGDATYGSTLLLDVHVSNALVYGLSAAKTTIGCFGNNRAPGGTEFFPHSANPSGSGGPLGYSYQHNMPSHYERIRPF
jgi:hypothetical protein